MQYILCLCNTTSVCAIDIIRYGTSVSYMCIQIISCKILTIFVFFLLCDHSGKCICEMCSKDKMRVPKIDEKKLFRVCNPCGKELKSQRVYGVRSAPEDA